LAEPAVFGQIEFTHPTGIAIEAGTVDMNGNSTISGNTVT
jgi:hypothetical protein